MIQSNVPSKSSQQQREDAVGNGDRRELVSAISVAFDEQTEREYTSRINIVNLNKIRSDLTLILQRQITCNTFLHSLNTRQWLVTVLAGIY